jgi:hypothetical protein
LLKIFIEKIPFNYGTNIYQSLGTTKFKSIYKFLNLFYDAVETNVSTSF